MLKFARRWWLPLHLGQRSLDLALNTKCLSELLRSWCCGVTQGGSTSNSGRLTHIPNVIHARIICIACGTYDRKQVNYCQQVQEEYQLPPRSVLPALGVQHGATIDRLENLTAR